jgi:hypothetical protein
VPYFKQLDGPKVLIGDNLGSHLSISVIEKCQELNIRFVLFLANSTHMCQPLDVAYFRELKRVWRQVLTQWKLKNKGCLPKSVFPTKLRAESRIKQQAKHFIWFSSYRTLSFKSQ